MNHFTKKELRYLHCALTYHPQHRRGDTFIELSKKLKKMMDNYCDHEPSDKSIEAFTLHLCAKCGGTFRTTKNQGE